jgi:hypothetical protein
MAVGIETTCSVCGLAIPPAMCDTCEASSDEQRLARMALLTSTTPSSPSANSYQPGGDHYRLPIQPWDFILSNGIPFIEGNIIKYVTRWRSKGGIEDLRKAEHYLEKLIEWELEKKQLEAEGEKP